MGERGVFHCLLREKKRGVSALKVPWKGNVSMQRNMSTIVSAIFQALIVELQCFKWLCIFKGNWPLYLSLCLGHKLKNALFRCIALFTI